MASDRYPKFVRVSEKAHTELKEAADKLNMPVSDLASRLILSGIDRLTPADAREV